MADKRPKSKYGSVRHRASGHYQAQVLVKGVRLTATLPTEDDGWAWIRRQLVDADEGLAVTEGRQTTVAVLLALWLKRRRNDLEEKTWATYESNIRCHIVPALGAVRLHQLTAIRLQQFYDSLAGHARTAQTAHVIVHQALDYAIGTLRILRQNVAEGASPESYRPPEKAVWTAAQLTRYLWSLPAGRWAATYWLLATTGLRLGEVCALRWADVDTERMRIAVRRNIQRVHQRGMVVGEGGKTDRSRSVPLLPEVLEHLGRWQERQQQERLAAGERWQDLGYVLTTRTGTAVEPDHVRRDWYKRLDALGLPTIHPHDLRHTYATLLLASGVPMKVVQELLGHRKLSTTMDLYAHVTDSMQEQAVTATRRLFIRPGRSVEG